MVRRGLRPQHSPAGRSESDRRRASCLLQGLRRGARRRGAPTKRLAACWKLHHSKPPPLSPPPPTPPPPLTLRLRSSSAILAASSRASFACRCTRNTRFSRHRQKPRCTLTTAASIARYLHASIQQHISQHSHVPTSMQLTAHQPAQPNIYIHAPTAHQPAQPNIYIHAADSTSARQGEAEQDAHASAARCEELNRSANKERGRNECSSVRRRDAGKVAAHRMP